MTGIELICLVVLGILFLPLIIVGVKVALATVLFLILAGLAIGGVGLALLLIQSATGGG